jgi:hypothetical protein
MQAADAVAVLAPVGESLAPEFGLFSGELVDADGLAACLFGVDPGSEVFGTQLGEGEQQIAEVALGIDNEAGHAVDECFFEQGEGEAGLAGAGHADAGGVGGEVLGVVEDEVVGNRLGGGVEAFAEVEGAEPFVVVHGRSVAQTGRQRGSTGGRARRRRVGAAWAAWSSAEKVDSERDAPLESLPHEQDAQRRSPTPESRLAEPA